jgi:hypothetical protein
MRIIVVTAGTLLVCFLGLMVTKYWGKARQFPEYQHPFFAEAAKAPIMFKEAVGLTPEEINTLLKSSENLFLEVAFTQDQVLVLPLQKFEKEIRYFSLADVKDKVLDITQLAPFLKTDRRVIFKLMENTRAEHEVFVENLKKVGMDDSKNFLVMSDYEAPLKSLKELAPAYIYGSTKPEILRIVAMQSMHILEAVNFRADVIVHPLLLRNQEFYNEELLNEMKRRHVKIIVGPISPSEMDRAQHLNPFGIIISSHN